MNGGSSLLLVVLFVGVFVVFFAVARTLDDDRIRQYISSRGGQLLEKTWEPFGPGWFGEKNDRIYLIAYRDSAGNLHQAYAKTSLLSGVYLRDDRVVRRASDTADAPTSASTGVAYTSEIVRLREENARLREELSQVKGEES